MNYILYKKGLIFDGAPHLEEQSNEREMKYLLKKNKAFLIRNVYDFDCQSETSFWYVIKDHFGGFEELATKTRNRIRRAQKLLDIKIVDKQLIIEQGYEVYLNSFKKYKNVISKPLSKSLFVNELHVDLPGEQFWGCIDRENGKLIAYSRNSIQDDMCDYCSMKVIPDYYSVYAPSYGLIYLMNEYYLQTLGLKYVSDGSRSITNHSNIQPFLIEKFGFRKAFCRLSIRYTWWLNIIILLLYPFRKFIKNKQIQALFLQDEMAGNNN
jgi:hypothetical protein